MGGGEIHRRGRRAKRDLPNRTPKMIATIILPRLAQEMSAADREVFVLRTRGGPIDDHAIDLLRDPSRSRAEDRSPRSSCRLL